VLESGINGALIQESGVNVVFCVGKWSEWYTMLESGINNALFRKAE
jgi:hypothetical protein